jgi:hypothetical protein
MRKQVRVALAVVLMVVITVTGIASAQSPYLEVPPDGLGVLGDNFVTATAKDLTTGSWYCIKWVVIYIANPRTPPAPDASPPASYGGDYIWWEDGTEESLTVNAVLSDCHWQPDAQFTLYYSPTGDPNPPYWAFAGSAEETTLWFDCTGGECGCTPGYWRNYRKHYDEWLLTPYRWDDDFDTVFGTNLFDPDKTLGQAIGLGGGGIKKLARHGTAALLSAAHPGVDYPLTVDQVIAAVRAGDADTLAAANELGCPLN